MPRRAPRREYFELEAHPAERVEYTLKLEIHKKNRIENVITIEGDEVGYKDHKVRARISLKIGAT